ncbi:hypothetical protein Q8A73_001014 [Channa argus]|nr:hypothetical protein Q8A73_001014 [Channa argus]
MRLAHALTHTNIGVLFIPTERIGLSHRLARHGLRHLCQNNINGRHAPMYEFQHSNARELIRARRSSSFWTLIDLRARARARATYSRTCSPHPELWIPRLGTNVHHDTARPSRSVKSVHWDEQRTRNWSARLCPGPPSSAAARQAAENSGGRELPGRQAGLGN